jgi:hypothetical protein
MALSSLARKQAILSLANVCCRVFRLQRGAAKPILNRQTNRKKTACESDKKPVKTGFFRCAKNQFQTRRGALKSAL